MHRGKFSVHALPTAYKSSGIPWTWDRNQNWTVTLTQQVEVFYFLIGKKQYINHKKGTTGCQIVYWRYTKEEPSGEQKES